MNGRELVGKAVVVKNPDIESARIIGVALAYSDEPTILVEQPGGLRLMVQAEWAAPIAHPNLTQEIADLGDALVFAWRGLDTRSQVAVEQAWPALAEALAAVGEKTPGAA
ncbi:hypothetical protein [Microbacterium sp. G2-8]|uniref:hypothetical protein n=1 Tax=Microbacterium sp. G2-8 TaxID=2842454 RepID=UPI001C8A2143|nr:hypothetical protein [Microbacterium sp. G2-8]